MKKFEFRLQRLLDLRESVENNIKNELAVIVNKQNALILQREEHLNKIALQRQKYSAKLNEDYSFEDIMMFERFADVTQREIEKIGLMIQNMEPDIQEVRDRLTKASKERKVVQRLKEKRWNEYLYELNREINKENDDTNQKIFLRRRQI